jgi:hypothetical protein
MLPPSLNVSSAYLPQQQQMQNPNNPLSCPPSYTDATPNRLGASALLAGRPQVDGDRKSKAQLIVGIDFASLSAVKTSNVGFTNIVKQGTTFSSVAFAFTTNNETKEDMMVEWPGAVNQIKQRVRRLRNSGDS